MKGCFKFLVFLFIHLHYPEFWSTVGVQESKTGSALWVGGVSYSLSAINHSDSSQSQCICDLKYVEVSEQCFPPRCPVTIVYVYVIMAILFDCLFLV